MKIFVDEAWYEIFTNPGARCLDCSQLATRINYIPDADEYNAYCSEHSAHWETANDNVIVAYI